MINYKQRSNVELFSLSTNSWNLIATGGLDLGDCLAEDIIHSNGALHWLIRRSSDWIIMPFSINNRTFKETLICEGETNYHSRFVFPIVVLF